MCDLHVASTCDVHVVPTPHSPAVYKNSQNKHNLTLCTCTMYNLIRYMIYQDLYISMQKKSKWINKRVNEKVRIQSIIIIICTYIILSTYIGEILRSITISYSIYSEEIHINCVVLGSCNNQASSMGV